MNQKLRMLFLSFVFFLLAAAALFYSAFLFVLPCFINSPDTTVKIQNKISQITGYTTNIDDINFSTYPSLTSELSVKKIALLDSNQKEIMICNDINILFKPLSIMPKTVAAGYLFFDKTLLKSDSNKKSNLNLNFNNLPVIKLNNADLILQKNKGNFLKTKLNDISVVPYGKKFVIMFRSEIFTNNVKNTITAGQNGYLYIENNNITANDFQINTENGIININGLLYNNNGKFNFTAKGKNIKVSDLKTSFLFFIKQKNSQKNFIENFYDFTGLADIDLSVKNNGIFGETSVKNLGAKTVLFSVPLNFPDIKFKFDGSEIHAAAKGTFGNEAVYTDLSVTNLFSKNRLVIGNVTGNLSKKFTDYYVPDLKISGNADFSVKYSVQNKEVTVEYLAKINEGSNIYYKNADLGKEESARRIYAKTLKKDNKLYLENYDYSFVNGEKIENIILGDGLFVKRNGRYALDYITCKTNGEAPVSVTGSFGKYVNGGTFSGQLLYRHAKNMLTGNFNLYNSGYKGFRIKNASINADEKNMIIKANGTYENANYSCDINMKNEFGDRITINNLDLYLEKYNIRRGHKTASAKTLKIPEKTKDITWTVENGKIKLDKLTFKNIVLENMELTGTLKKNIVKFSMPNINFAEGLLSANGTYNISDNSSDLYFSADNINSNIAAGMIFNLNNQVEGYANAKMHVKTTDKLENITAVTSFFIEQGALTKIGSTEFIIKKSKKFKHNLKFKLTDIINIDANRMKNIKSDIKGSFDVNNYTINNIELFSQHKYLSLFSEGDYNIDSEDAELIVWGKYNKTAQRGIKILFVPLSVITHFIFKPEHTMNKYREKLNRVPAIDAKLKETEAFTVRMNGNLNNNSSIKVEMKSIR